MLLALAGVLTQVAYPVTSGAVRDGCTVLAVLLFAASAVCHAVGGRGGRWAAGMLALTAGGGLVVELLGTSTGLPFGHYAYAAGRLGPELAGVPLLIGPAWTMGAYPAWCVASALLGPRRRVTVVLTAAWGLACWDLYLDPQMVADGRWNWPHPDPALPGVPGVPLSNYAGWLLVAVLMAAALAALDRLLTARVGSDALPQAVYCWTWLGSALAQAVFLDLPFSAAYGLLGMGALGVPLLVRAAVSGGPRRPACRGATGRVWPPGTAAAGTIAGWLRRSRSRASGPPGTRLGRCWHCSWSSWACCFPAASGCRLHWPSRRVTRWRVTSSSPPGPVRPSRRSPCPPT